MQVPRMLSTGWSCRVKVLWPDLDDGMPKAREAINKLAQALLEELDPEDIQAIADSLKSEGHKCHWPGCERSVPPRMWGCLAHWRALPRHIRDAIWAAYVPGQEIRKDPSAAYMAAAFAARDFAWFHDPELRRMIGANTKRAENGICLPPRAIAYVRPNSGRD